MMAVAGGYNVGETFDVHIFNCQTEGCSAAIRDLEKAFSGRCRCIADYKPCGLKKKWFLAYLKSSRYTIIHICKHAEDIVPLDCLPDEDLENIMCVKFNSETIQRPVGCKRHFSDFVLSDISTPEDVEKFVVRVVGYLSEIPAPVPIYQSNKNVPPVNKVNKVGGAKARKEKGKSLYGGQEASIYYNLAALGREANAILEVLDNPEPVQPSASPNNTSNHFQTVPTLFGGYGGEAAAHVVVPECLLNDESLVNAVKVHSSITEAINKLCSLGGGENARHIVYKMLPRIFESCKSGNGECVLSLASVALCKHPGIQQWALTLLELACLGDTLALSSAVDLRTIQNRLIQLAERLSGGSDAALEDESCVQLFHRLGNLLLLLQANITRACIITYSNGNTAADDSGLPDIAGLSSEMTSKKSFKGVTRLIKVSEVLRAASRKGSDRFYEKFRINLKDEHVYPETKKLLEMDWDTQILVLVECLKRIFEKKNQDCTSLPFLKDYLKQRTFRGLRSRRPNKICQELVLRGLAHFLFYSIEKNKDIKEQCEQAIKIMDSLWQDKKIHVDFIVARLLFESVPMIRHQMLDLYIKFQLYPLHLPLYLINEVEHQLSPCLSVDKKNKDQCSEQEGWLIFHGRFSNEEAIVMVHRPDLQAHRDRNMSKLDTGEDRLHNNQLMQLSQLRHRHIVSLLAFKTGCIPQFYILQSYGNDLQLELQNRRENQQLYHQLDLLRLLIQVVSAVEYCHNQGIIHRNLTAASLSAIAGPQHKALLGSFKLAHKLEHGAKEAIIKNDSDWLMRRWLAPESLRSLTFSRASDVWMLGVLMYEVLTHGILPYFDLPQDKMLVMKFFPQVNAGEHPSLTPELCLSTGCQQIMRACCQYLARDRPSVSELKKSLEGELATQHAKPQHEHPGYPELSARRRPSRNCYKGIPSISADDLKREYIASMELTFKRDITSNLKLYHMNEMCVFRERLCVRAVSEEFITKIHAGILEPWVPPILITSSEAYSNCIFFSCHLSGQGLMGSLFEVCASRQLGRAFINYVELLLQWTTTLRSLHDKQFGLADFCARTLWVQRLAGKCQVYPVSLAYLWRREDPSSDHCFACIENLTDVAVRNRCAPELLNEGKVHEAGDVFAMGVLIWQIIHAFFQEEFTASAANEPQAAATQQCVDGRNIQWVRLRSQFTTKFPKCPTRLIDLLCSCVASEPQRRPKWPEIKQKLESIMIQLRRLALKASPGVANPSLPRSGASSDSSTDSLSVANPSDGSDLSSARESSLSERGARPAPNKPIQLANPSDQSSYSTSDSSLGEGRNVTVGYVMNQDLGDRLSGLMLRPRFQPAAITGDKLEGRTKDIYEPKSKNWTHKDRILEKKPHRNLPLNPIKLKTRLKSTIDSDTEQSLSEGSDFEMATKAIMSRSTYDNTVDLSHPLTIEVGNRLYYLGNQLEASERYQNQSDAFWDTLSEGKGFVQATRNTLARNIRNVYQRLNSSGQGMLDSAEEKPNDGYVMLLDQQEESEIELASLASRDLYGYSNLDKGSKWQSTVSERELTVHTHQGTHAQGSASGVDMTISEDTTTSSFSPQTRPRSEKLTGSSSDPTALNLMVPPFSLPSSPPLFRASHHLSQGHQRTKGLIQLYASMTKNESDKAVVSDPIASRGNQNDKDIYLPTSSHPPPLPPPPPRSLFVCKLENDKVTNEDGSDFEPPSAPPPPPPRSRHACSTERDAGSDFELHSAPPPLPPRSRRACSTERDAGSDFETPSTPPPLPPRPCRACSTERDEDIYDFETPPTPPPRPRRACSTERDEDIYDFETPPTPSPRPRRACSTERDEDIYDFETPPTPPPRPRRACSTERDEDIYDFETPPTPPPRPRRACSTERDEDIYDFETPPTPPPRSRHACSTERDEDIYGDGSYFQTTCSVGSDTKTPQVSNALTEMMHKRAIRHSTDPLPSIPTEEVPSLSETNQQASKISTENSSCSQPEPDYFSIPSVQTVDFETENPYALIDTIFIPKAYSGAQTDVSEKETLLQMKGSDTCGLSETVGISSDYSEPLSNKSHLGPYSLAYVSSSSSPYPSLESKTATESRHKEAEVKTSGILSGSSFRTGLSDMLYISQDLGQETMPQSLPLNDSNTASTLPRLSPFQELLRPAAASHSCPQSLDRPSHKQNLVAGSEVPADHQHLHHLVTGSSADNSQISVHSSNAHSAPTAALTGTYVSSSYLKEMEEKEAVAVLTVTEPEKSLLWESCEDALSLQEIVLSPQPTRDVTQDSGKKRESQDSDEKRESQDSDEKRESQDSDKKRESQDSDKKRESQDSDKKRESQDSDEKRESQDSDKKRESQDSDKKRESQDSDKKRESQDSDKKRESQDSDNKRESQDSDKKREAQDSDKKRESQDSDKKRESQDSDKKRESQDSGKKRESQDSGKKRESQDSDKKREAQDSDKKRELQDSGKKRESQDSDKKRESQDPDEKRESQDSDEKREAQGSDENRESQDSDENRESQDSDEKREAQDSDEKREAQDSDEKREAQDSDEKRESQDSGKKRESQESETKESIETVEEAETFL